MLSHFKFEGYVAPTSLLFNGLTLIFMESETTSDGPAFGGSDGWAGGPSSYAPAAMDV